MVVAGEVDVELEPVRSAKVTVAGAVVLRAQSPVGVLFMRLQWRWFLVESQSWLGAPR